MKTRLYKPLAAVCTAILLLLVLAACGNKVENVKLSFVVDGATVTTVETTGNESIAIPDDPTKAGYTFDGWFWDKDVWEKPFTANSLLNAPISSSMAVYAKFTVNQYSITYDADGGTHTNPVSYTVEDSFVLSMPEKAGYTFLGWYNAAGTRVSELSRGTTGDIALTATYAPTEYSISYVNTKDVAHENQTSFTVEGDAITLLPLAKDGYTFLGWYNGETHVTSIPKGTIGNLTLTAKWTPIEYSIAYYGVDSATHANAARYDIEDTPLTLADAEWAGYRFLGWYTDAAFTSKVTSLALGTTGDINLYAKWETVSYTVTYENTKGVAHENQTSFTVESDAITLLPLAKDGYRFDGWYSGETHVTSIPKGTIGNLTLTAKWTPIEYTIIYEGIDGATHKNPLTYNIEDPAVALSDAQRAGYTFCGWYTDEGLETAVTEIATDGLCEITVYAKWEINTYTATFMDGDTVVDTVSFTVETDGLIEPTVPNRKGYNGAWESYTLGAASITVKAVYTAIPYTITYENTKGATNSNKTGYTIESAKFELLPLSKHGYTFAGWYHGDKKVTEIPTGSTGDLTLTAKWDAIPYTITYLYDGDIGDFAVGTTAKTTYTIEDSFAFDALVCKNAGYTFNGWFTEKNVGDGERVNGVVLGTTGDITVYAQFGLEEYTITYHNTNGAANSNLKKYNVTTESFEIVPLSRVGYTFDGWFSDEACKTPADLTVPKGSSGHIELYAKWSKISYSITYVSFGGAATGNPEAYTVTDSVSFNSATLDGYVFKGWYTAAEGGTKVTGITAGTTGHITVYAHWDYISTISFESNGGSSVSDTVNQEGVAISAPAAPTKEHYTFAGWYSDAALTTAYSFTVQPAEDITLYAKWTPVAYSIEYVLNDGKNASGNPRTYTIEDKIELLAPTKTGHTFVGWFAEPSFTTLVTQINKGTTGKVTLYAQYSINSYTISFESNGGTSVSPMTQNYATEVTAPTAPVKNGYSFAGWYTDAALTSAYRFTTMPAEDITLYARWTLSTYAIKYNLDNGKNHAENPTSYKITSATISLKAPTKTGYRFIGWYSDAAYENAVTEIRSGSFGALELFAKWEEESYSITYAVPEGTQNPNPAVYTISTDLVTLANATLKGYTFHGWYSDAGYTTAVTTVAGGELGNRTVYGKFTPNSYFVWLDGNEEATCTVSFDLNGAEGSIPAQNVTPTVTLQYPAVPTREGYVFAGWYANEACTGALYDFTAIVTNHVTLYAKWVKVENAAAISMNGSASVTLNGKYEQLLMFVPLVSGNITVTASGEQDTFGALYGDDMTLLVQDDDTGADGKSFLYVYNVTAGKTYYIGVRAFSSTTTGNATVSLTGDNTVLDGGYTVTTQKTSVTYGQSFAFAVPSARDGYKFLGYADKDGTMYTDATGASVKAWDKDEEATLYSVWEQMVYTVTFHTGSGSPIESVSLPYGQRLELSSYVTTWTGHSFVAWMLDGAVYNATTMPDHDITLSAKWTNFAVGDLKYDTDKLAISVNDTLDAELFSAICIDTDGNRAAITVSLIGGSVQVAGNSVTVRITATSGGKSKYITIYNVKVYGAPELSYDEDVDYVNIPNGITASHFGAVGTDTFGNATNIKVEIDGAYAAGELVTVIITATDPAGNQTVGRIENVKAYGAPVITYNENKNEISVNDTIGADLFGATAVDSFGKGYTVTVTKKSGTVAAGNTVTLTFSVTDEKGNTTSFEKQVRVYGAPTITDAATTEFTERDVITPEALGITAKDTYGELLTITLTKKSGTQTGGSIMVYTACVTDIAGNTSERDYSVKIYGAPTITVGKEVLKDTEDPLGKSSTVSFDLNGGSGTAPAAQTITDTVGLVYPTAPKRSGYVFLGWYTSPECTERFDFTANVPHDITVYAGWYRITTTGYSNTDLDIVRYQSNTYLLNSTYGSSSSKPIYVYFSMPKGGLFSMRYYNGSSSYDYKTCFSLKNLTQNKTILANEYVYVDRNSQKSVSFSAAEGDIICATIYRYSTSTYTDFYMGGFSGVSTPSGGKADGVRNTLDITATDSFGKQLFYDIALKSGSFAGGERAVYTITATDHLGNTTSIDTEEIKVYSEAGITLDYNPYSSTAVKVTSRGEELSFSATDVFGEACTLSVETASGSALTAGTVTGLYLVATDAAGNVRKSELIPDIKVYGLPTICYDADYDGVADSFDDEFIRMEEVVEDRFSGIDSFGDSAYVEVAEEGTRVEGGAAAVTVTVTDDAGNSVTREFRFHIGTAHDYSYPVVVIAPTCTERGYTTYTCLCGKSYADTYTAALDHTHAEGDEGAVTAPTCTAEGYTTYTCTRCGEAYDADATVKLPHTYVDRVCTVCGDVLPVYTRVDASGNEDADGAYILFGSYPQSEVTDSSLKAGLTTAAGTKPTSSVSNGWTSYKYYINRSNSTDFMWYKDIAYGGERYRAVYFTNYRPYWTYYSSSAGNTSQDDNGYTTGTIYFFRYDPIKWRILDEKNGKAFLLCEMLIDSQEYYHSTSSHTVNGQTVYANNYEHSNIRKWLNDSFYETAFDEYQQAIIQLTTVDNSAASTTDSGNNLTQATSYACRNTEDYVFLLSEKEVTTSAYGFASYSTYDTARQKKTTDYAQCQGAYTNSSYPGNGYWWLRSPYDYNSSYALYVYIDGYAYNDYTDVYGTNGGVCPALWISLG